MAELLGIDDVLVPADAGLLSALGLGVAVVERFAHRQVLEPLERARDRLAGWLAELGREAAAAVEAEGIAPEDVEVRRRLLNLRFIGQEAFLAVEYEEGGAIEEAFATAYQEVYGYAPEGRAIELESVRVVASSRSSDEDGPAPAPEACDASPAGTLRGVPFFDRAELAPGASFTGPALVFERHSATLVAEGWRGRVDGAGNLVLERTPGTSRTPTTG